MICDVIPSNPFPRPPTPPDKLEDLLPFVVVIIFWAIVAYYKRGRHA